MEGGEPPPPPPPFPAAQLSAALGFPLRSALWTQLLASARRNDTASLAALTRGTKLTTHPILRSAPAQRFKRNEFHPTRDFYFGGLTIAGPSEKLAKNRYDLSRCFLAGYNHRMEALFYKGSNPQERLEIDCCNLMDAGLPFVGVRGGEEVIVENAALGRENFRLPVQSDDVEYKGKRRSHKWCHKNDVQKFLASFVGLC